MYRLIVACNLFMDEEPRHRIIPFQTKFGHNEPAPRQYQQKHRDFYFCGNLDETKTFRVKFVDDYDNRYYDEDDDETESESESESEFHNIEFAYYKNPGDDNNYSVITLYNDKIYKSNQIKNNSLMMFIGTNNETKKAYCRWTNRFIFEYDETCLTLFYEPDENDEIGTFIRDNGLFGVSNKLYLLK